MKHWFAASLYLGLGLLFLLYPSRGLPATQEDTIAALQAQVAALTERLEALESRKAIPIQDYEAPTPVAPPPSTPGWTDRIKLSGDFRYRHETIDAEFADSDRHRNRIRARPALTAQITDTVDVGLGLATGGDDPASANQTLGEAFSKKPINVDLAYFNWRTPLDGLAVTAGKYKNPLYRAGDNGLIWDSDLRPEGSNVTFKSGGLTLTGLMNWITESSGSDNLFYGGQASWSAALGAESGLRIGAGFYELSDVEGQPVPFDGNPRGNSVDALNNYVNGYQELELFGELNFHIGERPTLVYANYVQNLDASEYDVGWIVGASVQFLHGKRPWELGYAYEHLEPDAVLGLFTDSDFIGGGTNGRGHIFSGSYALTKNISLGGTLFINERGGYGAGEWEDFNRLMLDIAFKY
ncbi:MAG: putative porin [Pseudomonadales bacterium]